MPAPLPSPPPQARKALCARGTRGKLRTPESRCVRQSRASTRNSRIGAFWIPLSWTPAPLPSRPPQARKALCARGTRGRLRTPGFRCVRRSRASTRNSRIAAFSIPLSWTPAPLPSPPPRQSRRLFDIFYRDKAGLASFKRQPKSWNRVSAGCECVAYVNIYIDKYNIFHI